MTDLIPAGVIINTHGVKGDVKAEVWLDGVAFLKRFKRVFINGSEIRLLKVSDQKGFALMKLEGVDDVNTAMKLKGREFCISRSDAKLPKGQYFIRDIIGASAVDENGNEIGILTEAFETPAQMIYVIKGDEEHLVPAIPEYIMSTDIENKIIVVRMIEGM